jgi:hypothetical protein
MARLSSPIRHLLALFGAVSLAVSLAGCSVGGEIVDGPDDPVDAGVADGCFANATGECVVATEGCDPSAIDAAGGERCAVCSVDGEVVDVCGEPEVAFCFDLEAPEPCQRCVTQDGVVLFDDCYESPEQLADLTCENVTYEDDTAAGATTCEVCRDQTGRLVSETCRPDADECFDVVVEGRACVECFAGGELAYRECEQTNLDPRVCEAYGEGDLMCVDCYGEADQLLSHECSVGGPITPPAFCDEYLDPDGRHCEVCYSQDGDVVSEFCDDVPNTGVERCEELSFSDQTCLLCVGAEGEPTFTECWSNVCPDDPTNTMECPPPPPCETHFADDGSVCRTCPTLGGESETLCLEGGDLFCSLEEVIEEPVPGNDPDPNQPPAIVVCQVCRDGPDGPVVYEECEDTSTEPPVCMETVSPDGVVCEQCFDPATGFELFNTCEGQPADMCFDEVGVLRGENGGELFLPADASDGTNDALLAEYSCYFCGDADDPQGLNGYGDCVLRPDACGGVQPQPGDPDDPNTDPAVCSVGVVVVYEPMQIEPDPWGSSDGIDGMVNALTWLLSNHGVAAYSVTHEPVDENFVACEGGECPRGDRLYFSVTEQDALMLLNLGVGFFQ